jgi:DNA-binding NtrC family response regulator
MSPPSSNLAPWTRVLVASRDRVFARSLEASLESKGAEVHLWEGPGAWSAEGPQLEEVDVLLVETYGLREAEWSLVERARERSPMVEIVAISEDPLVEGAVQALRSGVYTLLAYPVSDDQLLEAITEATARKRRGEKRIKALERPPEVKSNGEPRKTDPVPR